MGYLILLEFFECTLIELYDVLSSPVQAHGLQNLQKGKFINENWSFQEDLLLIRLLRIKVSVLNTVYFLSQAQSEIIKCRAQAYNK